MDDRTSTTARALRLDPTRCDGVGMCAYLAPRDVGMDTWGFAVIRRRDVPDVDLPAARAAVRACPHRALSLG